MALIRPGEAAHRPAARALVSAILRQRVAAFVALLAMVGSIAAVSVRADPVRAYDVPRISESPAGACSPIACLQAALSGMGKRMAYERLMVASGAAFRATWAPGKYDEGAAHFYQHDPIILGAASAGVRAEVVRLASVDAAWKVIAQSINRDRLVISWDDGQLRFQVICGYDPDEHVVLCRTHGSDREQYRRRAPSTVRGPRGRQAEYELWVLDDEGRPVPDPDWRIVLTRAVQMARWPEGGRLQGRYVCGLRAYEAWIETLRDGDARQAFPDAGRVTYETAMALSDARSSAAMMLAGHAHVHDAFAEAAAAYRREAEQLARMRSTLCRGEELPAHEVPDACNEGMAEADVREAATAVIEAAVEHERVALAALTRALEDLSAAERVVAQAPVALEEQGAGAQALTADELVVEAMTLKSRGEFDAAAASFRAALERDDRHVAAHWGLAWVLVKLDERQEAIAHLQRVVELTEDEDLEAEARAAIQRLQSR